MSEGVACARYAIYYAPAADDPLWRDGCAWLGRDPGGLPVGPPPCVPGIAAVTADARQYGFHATLKAPMRLRHGASREDLLESLAAVARGLPAFPLPALAVADADGFLCLREVSPSMPLQALADAMVAGVDHLRAPLGDAGLARRRAGRLTAAQDAALLRWGYPAVFGTWFFHMTLTRRLTPAEAGIFRPAARAWFGPALAQERVVSDIAVFEQPAPGEEFALGARLPLAS